MKYAARGLRRSPGFSITAIAVMALLHRIDDGAVHGGSCGTARSVALPRPESTCDGLRALAWQPRGGNPYNPVAPGDFLEWRKSTHGFEDMASYHSTNFNVSGDHGELPEVVKAQQGTWNFFLSLVSSRCWDGRFEKKKTGSAVIMWLC